MMSVLNLHPVSNLKPDPALLLIIDNQEAPTQTNSIEQIPRADSKYIHHGRFSEQAKSRGSR